MEEKRSTMTLAEEEEMRAEVARLTGILNTPMYQPFLEAVKNEAAHQE